MKTESEIDRRRKTWIVVAALTILAVALAFSADALAAPWINIHSPSSLKRAGEMVSRIGDWPAHVTVGLIGATIAWFSHRKDWVRIFLAMLIACALAGIAARAIKIATGRARPLVKTEAVWNGPRFSAKYNAFPSGHTASSTAFFAALFLARRKIGAPLFFIPTVIGAARIITGAHYLSDVTFAAALGIACALVTIRVLPPGASPFCHSERSEAEQRNP